LKEYLSEWKIRQQDESHPWKFNKVLQEWAIQNCTDPSKLHNKVFKKLLPYLVTIQGSARTRLESIVSAARENNNESNNSSAQGDDMKVEDNAFQRALKIQSFLDYSS
jgi:hypothetical protein